MEAIFAKTRMKRIPDTCKKCSLSCYDPQGFSGEYARFCSITGKPCPTVSGGNGNIKYGKPKNCPLVMLDVPEGNEAHL